MINLIITKEQAEIMRHTVYTAAGRVYCGDSPDMQILVKEWLMESAGKKGFCPDEYFRITAKGKEFMKSL